jgi:hypothetical protein
MNTIPICRNNDDAKCTYEAAITSISIYFITEHDKMEVLM